MANENEPTDPDEQKLSLWRTEHVIALLAAIIVVIIVFQFTGESELFIAIGSGMGAGGLAWLLSWLHLQRRA